MKPPIPAPVLGTSRLPEVARTKVETGSTAFHMGRAFRAYTKKELLNGEQYALEIVTPVDVDITSIVLNVTAGEITYQGIVLPDTAAGFTEVRPIYPLNDRDDVLTPQTPLLTITGGGTITGGIEVETIVVRTGSNNQRVNIVEQAQARRGASPGNYYLLFTAGTQGGDFTIYSTWEE